MHASIHRIPTNKIPTLIDRNSQNQAIDWNTATSLDLIAKTPIHTLTDDKSRIRGILLIHHQPTSKWIPIPTFGANINMVKTMIKSTIDGIPRNRPKFQIGKNMFTVYHDNTQQIEDIIQSDSQYINPYKVYKMLFVEHVPVNIIDSTEPVPVPTETNILAPLQMNMYTLKHIYALIRDLKPETLHDDMFALRDGDYRMKMDQTLEGYMNVYDEYPIKVQYIPYHISDVSDPKHNADVHPMGSAADFMPAEMVNTLVMIWDNDRCVWMVYTDGNRYDGMSVGEFINIIGNGYTTFELVADINGERVALLPEDEFASQKYRILYIKNKADLEFKMNDSHKRTLLWPIIGCIIGIIVVTIFFVYGMLCFKRIFSKNTDTDSKTSMKVNCKQTANSII